MPGSKIDFDNNVFNIEHVKQGKHNLAQSKTFQFFLSKEEYSAVESYCEQDYRNINHYLYGDNEHVREDIKRKVATLDGALRKFPKPSEPRQVYRAGKPYHEGKIQSYEEFDTPEQAAQFYEKEYPVGKVIEFKGFTSTTEDPNCLVDFTVPGFDSHPPSGIMNAGKTREQYNQSFGRSGLSNIIYEISTREGAPVSAFGHTYAEKEQEILLPRNTKFKVKAVHPNRIMNFTNRLPFGDKQDKRTVTIIQLEEI